MALKKTRLKRVVSFTAKGTKRPLKANSAPSRRTTKPKKKAWKFKKTELAECDEAFSKEIRERDGRCLFPGCHVDMFSALQCSHYEGRARWETRFDPDNCIALCWHHHFKSKLLGYEYQKQREELHGFDGQYTKHMKLILGEYRFQALIEKPKKSRKEAILETQKKYNLRQPEALLEE